MLIILQESRDRVINFSEATAAIYCCHYDHIGHLGYAQVISWAVIAHLLYLFVCSLFSPKSDYSRSILQSTDKTFSHQTLLFNVKVHNGMILGCNSTSIWWSGLPGVLVSASQCSAVFEPEVPVLHLSVMQLSSVILPTSNKIQWLVSHGTASLHSQLL